MSLPRRARLTYAALFASIAAATPYLALYYRQLGLDLGAIGLVIAAGSTASILAGPLWGAVFDRSGGSPRVFIAAAAMALAGNAVLWLAAGLGSGAFGALLIGVALFAGAVFGISAMLDARALELSGPQRAGYGPQRAWGSVSFVVVAFGTGVAVDRFGLEAFLVILAVALILTGALGFSLGPARTSTVVASGAVGIDDSALRALATPALGMFLGGAFLTFTTLAGLNSFISLRFAELGAPAAIIGSSWAVGAAVEVPVMLWFPRLAARVGSERLMIAGILVFALRALGSAVANDPAALVALTGIGGLGYATFLVGGVTYVSSHAPARLAATAQGLFNGAANNLGQITAGVGGGRLADSIGITGLFGASAFLGVVASIVVALAVRLGGRPTTGQPTTGRPSGQPTPDQATAGATSEINRSIVSSS